MTMGDLIIEWMFTGGNYCRNCVHDGACDLCDRCINPNDNGGT